MNVSNMYEYLVLARRDLIATLESVPTEVLTRPPLNGERFKCIQDLLLHAAQIVTSLRIQGLTPPSLDLVFHRPSVPRHAELP